MRKQQRVPTYRKYSANIYDDDKKGQPKQEDNFLLCTRLLKNQVIVTVPGKSW